MVNTHGRNPQALLVGYGNARKGRHQDATCGTPLHAKADKHRAISVKHLPDKGRFGDEHHSGIRSGTMGLSLAHFARVSRMSRANHHP